MPILAAPGLKAGQLVVVGLGRRDEVDAGVLYRAAATASRHLAGRPRAKVVFVADGSWTTRQVEQAVAGAAVGMVGQDLYRAEKKRTRFGSTVWLVAPPEAVARGVVIGEGVNLARRLVNMPPDDLYPQTFSEEAAAVAGRTGMEIEIWDEEQLARERCQAILAVGRGSSRSPRLVILRYRGPGAQADQPDLAFVGKGVTFDSGGLSLKPSDSMLTMKCDMSGGAAVLAAAATIAALKLPVNIVAAIGLVENMTGPAAYKLGDVITARSGTTIEIHNTDAEGRVVLADVLDVVRGYKPKRIIDAATLTGACMVALGHDVAGLFSNDQNCCNDVADVCRLRRPDQERRRRHQERGRRPLGWCHHGRKVPRAVCGRHPLDPCRHRRTGVRGEAPPLDRRRWHRFLRATAGGTGTRTGLIPGGPYSSVSSSSTSSPNLVRAVATGSGCSRSTPASRSRSSGHFEQPPLRNAR